MQRFKTRVKRQPQFEAGGDAAKWAWEVTETGGASLKVVGCGTATLEESAKDAAALALANFLEARQWLESRQGALRHLWKAA